MGLGEKKLSQIEGNQAKKEEAYVDFPTVSQSEDDSIELDVIERLKSNISMLEDLSARLYFMNTELEGVIGTKKLLK